MNKKKYIGLGELEALGKECKKLKKTLVLSNGCFDLIHVGHTRYLSGAKDLGDVLVVALNSDSSVSKLKGKGRPFISEDDRAEILSTFSCVDYIIVFSDPNVERIIRLLKPDYHAKGTDYTVDSVPERDVVMSVGGKVAIVGDPKDHSTTELLENINKS